MQLDMDFLPMLVTLVFVASILYEASGVFSGRPANPGNEQKFPRQMIMTGLGIAGLTALAMALPAGVSMMAGQAERKVLLLESIKHIEHLEARPGELVDEKRAAVEGRLNLSKQG